MSISAVTDYRAELKEIKTLILTDSNIENGKKLDVLQRARWKASEYKAFSTRPSILHGWLLSLKCKNNLTLKTLEC